MINARSTAWLIIVLVMSYLNATSVFAAPIQKKPQLPLQISLAPTRPEVTPDTIRPGDVIDFKVSATSMLDTAEMRIEVKLAEGAELVSGDLSWAGPAGKKEEKLLFFSVRVPASGVGKIKASLTISTNGARPLTRMAQYLLLTGEHQKEQLEAQKKRKATHPVRKDGKGRPIVEY